MIGCAHVPNNNNISNNIIETTVVESEIPATTESEYTFFNPDSIFSYEYIYDGEIIPHILFTPSISDESRPKPLIVWLHGTGARNANKLDFLLSGLPLTINMWLTDGFDAYILCPHLTGKWNISVWNYIYSADNLKLLLDKFISEHNVDTDNIVIVGHSLGGQGALYMAHQLPEYFSKCVVLSGYPAGIDISEITIPTIGYVGQYSCGESRDSINYMMNYFAPVFGEENTFSIPTSHGKLPFVVFNQDVDDNNRSDVIEWMFDSID